MSLSRRPLAIEKGREGDGSKVVQDASSEPRVVWRLEKDGDAYRIVNARTAWPSTPRDRARSRRGGGIAAPVRRGASSRSGDAYHIRSRGSGGVLDVSGGSTRGRHRHHHLSH